jgi:putative aminopeptidase FrvX
MKRRDPFHHPSVDLLRELLAIPSPPGREDRMAAFVAEKIRSLGFDAERDPAGNLLVRIHADAPGAPVMLAAHMDEIALVVARIEDDGRLRVVRSGGMTPHKLGERAVDILGDVEIIPGIVSSGSGHRSADAAPPTWADYWITTGLSAARLREKGVHPGSAIVPAREARGPVFLGETENPLVAAWTFDDRMGVLALLRLLENLQARPLEHARSLILAFTVHEEGGAHGAKFLTHRERPDTLVAVDGCPLAAGSGLKMDRRPAVWAKDAKANYSHCLILELEAAARSAGVELQRVVLENAYSDASAAYDCGGVGRFATIGHVRENSHGFEIASLGVLDSLPAVLEAFVRQLESSAPVAAIR